MQSQESLNELLCPLHAHPVGSIAHEMVMRKTKQDCSSLLLGRDHAVNGLSLFQLFLHLHHQLDTINHHLDLLDLRGTQTIGVGDVKHTTHGRSVYAALRESQ